METVILDRDGVINEDSDVYIKSPEEWIPIPGSLEAIARLNHAGYRVVVATNQSGVARGYFDLETLAAIHAKMEYMVQQAGGHLDGVFFCPHGPDDGCDCRKPQPGLLLQIAQQFKLDLPDSVVIGDSLRDLQAAMAVHAKPILVRTGKGEQTITQLDTAQAFPIFDNLARVVDHLLTEKVGR
jgi:D-glycero-D-manno-heptose 1,7-bisphosphate phosphatase